MWVRAAGVLAIALGGDFPRPNHRHGHLGRSSVAARRNAAIHAGELHSSARAFCPVLAAPPTSIVSNPPSGRLRAPALAPEVFRHEPHAALFQRSGRSVGHPGFLRRPRRAFTPRDG